MATDNNHKRYSVKAEVCRETSVILFGLGKLAFSTVLAYHNPWLWHSLLGRMQAPPSTFHTYFTYSYEHYLLDARN